MEWINRRKNRIKSYVFFFEEDDGRKTAGINILGKKLCTGEHKKAKNI